MRKTLSALVIAATAAVGLLIPAAAHAATAPSVLWAGSVEGDFGRIQVGTLAESGVASIKVHVMSPQTSQELAVVDSFHRTDGTGAYGIWQADQEVVLPDLGYYQLNVELTDNDGVHSVQESAGWLVYAVQMYFKNLNVTNTVKYTKREVTVSGRLMGRWPGTGEEKPVVGYPIEYATSAGFWDGVTDNAGQFKLTGEIESADDFGYLTTLWDTTRPFYLQAFADTQTPEIHQADTKLTINLDRETIAEGEPVTVSGVLTWHSPKAWEPVRNAYVAVMVCQSASDTYCGSYYTFAFTDDQGRYSVTIAPYSGVLVKAGTANYDPFVTSPTYASAPLTVTHPSSFSDFNGYRLDNGQIMILGHLNFGDHFSPGGPIPVEIQFSPDGNNPWKTLRTIDLQYSPWNPEGIRVEEYFDFTEPGYWRASYTDPSGFFGDSVSATAFVG